MAELRSKEDLEARLKERSASISRRFSSLEEVIPAMPGSIPEVLKTKRTFKAGLAAGAGFLIGFSILRRRKRHRDTSWEDGVEHLTHRLGDAIVDHLDRSESPEEAVRKALKENPPIIRIRNDSESAFSGALRELLNSGSSLLISELGRWVQHRMLEKKEHPEAD